QNSRRHFFRVASREEFLAKKHRGKELLFLSDGCKSGRFRKACRTFPCDDRALTGLAPVIISNNTGLADYAMARDEICEWILSDGRSDCARGGGFINHVCQSPVTRECAGLHVQQRPPDTHLKRRAANKRAQWSAGLRHSAFGENLFSELGSKGIVTFPFC